MEEDVSPRARPANCLPPAPCMRWPLTQTLPIVRRANPKGQFEHGGAHYGPEYIIFLINKDKNTRKHWRSWLSSGFAWTADCIMTIENSAADNISISAPSQIWYDHYLIELIESVRDLNVCSRSRCLRQRFAIAAPVGVRDEPSFATICSSSDCFCPTRCSTPTGSVAPMLHHACDP